jgi:hypothetical protein
MLHCHMIVASLPLLPNLRELCARRLPRPGRGVKTHPQPHPALSYQSASLALIPWQTLASLGPHTNSRNPFPLMALLHTSLYTADLCVHSLESARSASQLAANSFRIRTYGKYARNPLRIRTSKTKDLKPFRMNTYEKRGGMVGPLHCCVEDVGGSSF